VNIGFKPAGTPYRLDDQTRTGSVKINGLGWQEWQGSNLRPPVLENGSYSGATYPLIAISPIYKGFRMRDLLLGTV
jgi:hypothetical protein